MLFWRLLQLYSLTWIFNIKACQGKLCERETIHFISPPHTALGHTFTHTAADTHRVHSLCIFTLLSSPPIDCCYVLWRHWTTPNNTEHLLYSSLSRPPVLCFHTPTTTPPAPHHPPPNPASGVPCLPFISFHLSGLLNSTTGIKARCVDGVAAPRQKSIFTSLHISMLTNGLPFSGYDTMNRIICSSCTDASAASCGTLKHLKCSLTRSGFPEVSAENREANMCLWIRFTLYGQ